MINTKILRVVMVAGLSLLLASSAFAADLNYTSDTTVSLGGHNYTILAGSAATTLVVNDNNVVVTVPSSSTFTFVSPEKFVLSTDSNLKQTCSTISSVTVVGAATVTITPSTEPCSNSSGGGHQIIPPVVHAVGVGCKAGDKFSSTTGLPCANTVVGNDANKCYILSVLKQGAKGQEVKCLQTTLKISSDGAFGPKTKLAVVAFQKSKALVGDGIVGPKTVLALFK